MKAKSIVLPLLWLAAFSLAPAWDSQAEEGVEHHHDEDEPAKERDLRHDEAVQTREELSHLRNEAERLFDGAIEDFVEGHLPEAVAFWGPREETIEEAGPVEQFAFYEGIIMLAERVRELLELRRHEPERFHVALEHTRLDIRARILAREHHMAREEEHRERLAEELRGVLEEGFRLSQELREMEAHAIERELDEIWELLEMRNEHREIIIERRFHELLHDQDPLAW